MGGKEEWEGDEIPGTDEDAHEPPVGDVGETGYGDEIPSEETAMGDEGWAVLWLASPIVMLWMLWVAGGGV